MKTSSIASYSDINNNQLDKTTLLFSEPYLPGGQPDDSRITIEEQTVDAPDYTEGERNWQQSTLTIDTPKRKMMVNV